MQEDACGFSANQGCREARLSTDPATWHVETRISERTIRYAWQRQHNQVEEKGGAGGYRLRLHVVKKKNINNINRLWNHFGLKYIT